MVIVSCYFLFLFYHLFFVLHIKYKKYDYAVPLSLLFTKETYIGIIRI